MNFKKFSNINNLIKISQDNDEIVKILKELDYMLSPQDTASIDKTDSRGDISYGDHKKRYLREIENEILSLIDYTRGKIEIEKYDVYNKIQKIYKAADYSNNPIEWLQLVNKLEKIFIGSNYLPEHIEHIDL